jgi:uncharacterized protein YciI
MEFDELTLARLVNPRVPADLSADEAARLQDAHLAHLHSLWLQGLLVGAGPAQGDDTVRGLALLRADTDTTRALMERDPSIQGGLFELEVLTWFVPAGMVVSGEGAPPSSVAEARS